MKCSSLEGQERPVCPTCSAERRMTRSGSQVMCSENDVWLCLQCGTEYTIHTSVKSEPGRSKKYETRPLLRLPPDAFIG